MHEQLAEQVGAQIWALRHSKDVYKRQDLSPVAHLAAIEGKVPFLNFFDGFRTSHEYQKIEKWDYADLKEMCNMEAVEEFRKKALNPENPKMRGSHENGDVFFQHREACNSVYNALPFLFVVIVVAVLASCVVFALPVVREVAANPIAVSYTHLDVYKRQGQGDDHQAALGDLRQGQTGQGIGNNGK